MHDATPATAPFPGAPPARSRLVGVDVTRGLAVLGMVAAHVGGMGGPLLPWGWLVVADGRSAATFATLAGLSVGLLAGGPAGPRGWTRLAPTRARVAVRAGLLAVVGVLLETLGTPVAVILPGYALMMVLLLPVLGLRRRWLLALAAVLLVVGPLVHTTRMSWLPAALTSWPGSWFADLAVGQFYPAVVWTAYLLVGLALGRSDLRSRRTRVRLAVSGVLALVVGYGAGALLLRSAAPGDGWRDLVTPLPHTSTAFEVGGNLGVVLLVLVGCLVLAERRPRLVAPVAAVGATALSAYVGHLLVIGVAGPDIVFEPRWWVLVALWVTIVAGCWAWRTVRGRGPLELALHVPSVAAARAVAERAGQRTRAISSP